MSSRIKRFLLIFGDILLLYFSLFLTLRIRYGARFETSVWDQHLLPFTFVYFIWVIIFYTAGLYSLISAGNYKNFFRTLAVNAAVAVGFFYLVPYFAITPKTNLFLNLAIFSGCGMCSRTSDKMIVSNSPSLKGRFLVMSYS